MSYSHCSSLTQALQRVIRGAQQLRGECGALLMGAMLLGNFQL